MAEGIIRKIEEDVEELFKPKPGGQVDQWRKKQAAEQAAIAEQNEGAQDTLIKARPVAVDPVTPDIGIAVTVTLNAANPVLILFPRNPDRRSAVILSADNPVYLATSPGLAQQAAASGGTTFAGAFYLPTGIALPWQNTDALYAAVTTTSGNSRVSVMSSFKGVK